MGVITKIDTHSLLPGFIFSRKKFHAGDEPHSDPVYGERALEPKKTMPRPMM